LDGYDGIDTGGKSRSDTLPFTILCYILRRCRIDGYWLVEKFSYLTFGLCKIVDELIKNNHNNNLNHKPTGRENDEGN